MAFCGSCGAQLADGVTVCSKCGKSAAVGTGGGAAAAPAMAPAQTANAGLQDNIAGLLCYSPVGLIADIIFLVAEPYKTNKFIRFHAFQSLFFGGACFALSIGLMIVNVIVGMVFAPLAIVLGLAELVLWLGVMAAWVFMMYKAFSNTTFKLPVIGAMAEKQANAI